MSDVKNIWVLKQPVTKTDVYYNDARLPYFGIDELKGIDFSCMHPDVFYSFFEPLDVESLTTQLEEILLGYSSHEYVRGFDEGKNWEGEDEPILRDVESLAEAVAEVLKLIGVKQ